MATKNISSRFRNNEKREHESIVCTVPAILVNGGGRTTIPTEYVQYGDDIVMSVAPGECIFTKAYLIVEEAFPTGAKISVNGLGGALFTDVAGDAVAMSVSTVVDVLGTTPGDITVNVTHATATGDVTTGVARVVLDTIPYTIKNGNYTVNA